MSLLKFKFKHEDQHEDLIVLQFLWLRPAFSTVGVFLYYVGMSALLVTVVYPLASHRLEQNGTLHVTA